MRNQQSAWRWLGATLLATVLLGTMVFVVPPAWFAFLFDINRPQVADATRAQQTWLALLPPLAIQVEQDPETVAAIKPLVKPPEPFEPALWWNQSVGIALVEKESSVKSAISRQDSVRNFLHRLGLSEDFMLRTRPDSVLAARLQFMQMEDSFDLTEAKPYLQAMTRARAYEDIMSRAAAMFDEFLGTRIMVPD